LTRQIRSLNADDSADWFRQALKDCGIGPCIAPKSNRSAEVLLDKAHSKSRRKIGNMSGRLKDWRRACTRCNPAFPSAPAIAATIIFWMNQ
jgi:hypothetical protein